MLLLTLSLSVLPGVPQSVPKISCINSLAADFCEQPISGDTASCFRVGTGALYTGDEHRTGIDSVWGEGFMFLIQSWSA